MSATLASFAVRPPREDTLARENPQVDLVFFDAGGGHRASALALKEMAERQHRGWRIRMVNLREVLEPIDIIRRTTGVRIENVYNTILKYGLTLGTGAMLRTTQALIRRLHPQQVALLARFWEEPAPDLVVSMIPNFNRALFEGLRAADFNRRRQATPMVTILTDLADYPPHFWIERQAQYFVCGSALAAQQALAMGHPTERVFRTSGMIVHPDFYASLRMPRESARLSLGLEPSLPTGIVMFGGYGSRRMLTIAARVAAAGLRTQLIFLCGRNQELCKQLGAMALPYPHRIEGFTREVPALMRLADYFIGKPGPGSISEALASGLPVVVERNLMTMVQERYNADWIALSGLGVVLRSFSRIADAVALMIDPRQLSRLRENVRKLGNLAIFEIPEILERLIAARDGAPYAADAARTVN